VLSLSKKGLSSEIGKMRKVFEIFEAHGIAVEYTPNGIDTVSLVVATQQLKKKESSLAAALQEALDPDRLEFTDGIAIVAAVGRKMANRPGITGQIFSALGSEGINIRLISQGPREVNIIFGVDNRDFKAAVRVLYNSFVK
jgi:aspartate kinase